VNIRSPKPLRNKPTPIQTHEAKLNQSTETLNALADWYFEKEDEKSLSKFKKNDLVEMCAERGIETEEKDKQTLIDDLLHWRKHALPPGATDLLKQSISDLTEIGRSSPNSKPRSKSLRR